MKPFIDTNILVYANSNDHRRPRALEILAEGGVVSVQVLNELTNVLLNKLRKGWPEIQAAIDDVRTLLDPALPLSVDTHVSAIGLARDHGLSFYDALIVASAHEAGCTVLLTEDMQHGRAIGTLTIRNPFL
ncbi:MAG: PIN domain-containing protein [Hyphomicrobiales bacterium]